MTEPLLPPGELQLPVALARPDAVVIAPPFMPQFWYVVSAGGTMRPAVARPAGMARTVMQNTVDTVRDEQRISPSDRNF